MPETTAPPIPREAGSLTWEEYKSGACELEDIFGALPEEISRRFELKLAGIALHADRERLRADLERLVQDPLEDIAYAAFYCNTIHLRRMKDFSQLDRWFMTHGYRFTARPTYDHTKVVSDLDRGLGNVDIRQTLDMAKRYARDYPEHSGFVHLLADVVATARELELEQGIARLSSDDVAAGLHAANAAISLEPDYAKFYATKARILALDKDFSDAMTCIGMAIDKEDSARADYAIRIGNYQFLRLQIQARINDGKLRADLTDYSTTFRQRHEDAENRLEESLNRMDGSTLKNLEFLGFFAALISFTIGSVQMAVSYSPREAAGLIVVLMGALLVAFAGFSFILERHLKTSSWRVLIAGCVGLVACVGGALIWLR